MVAVPLVVLHVALSWRAMAAEILTRGKQRWLVALGLHQSSAWFSSASASVFLTVQRIHREDAPLQPERFNQRLRGQNLVRFLRHLNMAKQPQFGISHPEKRTV